MHNILAVLRTQEEKEVQFHAFRLFVMENYLERICARLF